MSKKIRQFFRWLILGEGAKFNRNAKDGDKDGKVQDGTIFERPAKKKPAAKKSTPKKSTSKSKK